MEQEQNLGLHDTLSQTGLIGITWAGVAVALGFVAARAVIRLDKVGHLSSDDYLLFTAFLVFVVYGALQTVQIPSVYYVSRISLGLESDPRAITAEGGLYLRYEFAIMGLFWTVLWLVKGSFLMLYFNLMNGLKIQRRVWWFVAAFTVLAYVGCWIASFFVCKPLSSYFQFGDCDVVHRSTIAITYGTAADIVTDIMSMFSLTMLVLDHTADNHSYDPSIQTHSRTSHN